MDQLENDGLVQLQSESRISATKWREWCALFNLKPAEAAEVWYEIGYPLMLTTGQVPAIPYILQLRAERREVDIFDFKAEIAKLLSFLALLDNLRDENLTTGPVRSAIARFYWQTTSAIPSGSHSAWAERFVAELGAVILVARALHNPNITLNSVLRMLIKGRTTLPRLIHLGLQALGEEPYAGAIRRYLEDPCVTPEEDPGTAPAEAAVEEPAREEAGVEAEEGEANGGGETEAIATEEEAEKEKEPSEEVTTEEETEKEESPEEVEETTTEETGELPEEAATEEEETPAEETGESSEKIEEEKEKIEDGYVAKFRTALHAIYQIEALGDKTSTREEVKNLLRLRLEAIAEFDPLRTIIPSIEEAQALARHVQNAQDRERIHELVQRGARRGSKGGARGPGASASGRTYRPGPSRSGTASGIPAGTSSTDEVEIPVKDVAETRAEDEDEIEIEIADEDVVEVSRVKAAEFSQAVRQTVQLLEAAEKADETVWGLFLEPAAEIAELPSFAPTLAREDSTAHQAGRLIKGMAQYLSLKDLLDLPEGEPEKIRKFTLEVDGFVNVVKNHKMALSSDDRQLAPLKKILDHAAATLLRLETLRFNQNLSQKGREAYSRETVALYGEKALQALADLAGQELWEQARARAGQDTDFLVSAWETELFISQLVACGREWVEDLQSSGATHSLEAVKAAISGNPLQLESAEEQELLPQEQPDSTEGQESLPQEQPDSAGEQESPPRELLEELLKPGGLGEIFDEVCNHVCTTAWEVLASGHDHREIIGRLQRMLRESLAPIFVLEPQKRRHAARPRLSLSVISLDRLGGDPQLKNLYVRVGVGGRLLFVEGFEDGTYLDLFELREYTPMRMQSSGDKTREEGTEPLQTGEKYLHTVGRTNQLFGATPGEVIESCVREEDGEIKIFPVFHPKRLS